METLHPLLSSHFKPENFPSHEKQTNSTPAVERKSALLTFHKLKLHFVYRSFKHHNAHLKKYNIIYNETDIIFLFKNLTVTSLTAYK